MLKKFKGLLEKQEGEIVGIASTEAIDRDGESISQSGWDLENFKSNPVILASHNYYEFPIGKATDIQISDGKLIFKAIFSQATAKAKEAYQLVQEGILKTFSVGFIPREYDPNKPNCITKAELLEISLVSVPANPEALVLAKGMKENRMAQDIIKHWLITEKEITEEAKEEEIKEETEEEKAERLAKEVEEEKARAEAEIKKEEEAIEAIKNEENSDSTTESGNTEVGVDSAKTDEEKDFDVKLLQKTVGHLQNLLHEVKTRNGGEEK